MEASDIPPDVREAGARLLPVRLSGATREVQGQELEFIFRSLVELKMQIEDLRQRVDDVPHRVEVREVVGRSAYEELPLDTAIDATEEDAPALEASVVYRPGMTMAEVERAAIEAALESSKGNRRRAAESLGIGERTLYRKLKQYQLA